jgi:hypothetical protein
MAMAARLHVIAASHPCACVEAGLAIKRVESAEAWGEAVLQIGSSVRQLGGIADVEELHAGRPAVALARHFPPMDGRIPAGTAPSEWLGATAA